VASVAGGIHNSLPAKKREKGEEENTVQLGCLMHYKGKPSAFYTDDMFDEKLAPSVPL